MRQLSLEIPAWGLFLRTIQQSNMYNMEMFGMAVLVIEQNRMSDSDALNKCSRVMISAQAGNRGHINPVASNCSGVYHFHSPKYNSRVAGKVAEVGTCNGLFAVVVHVRNFVRQSRSVSQTCGLSSDGLLL